MEDAIFTTLGAVGALSAAAFTTGTAATSSGHRIIYDQATGNVFYDADGNGGGATVTLFATVNPVVVLTAAEFFVI